jgi:hypothetical protein
MSEALEDLRTFIANHVREGFESAHEIVEKATEFAYGKYERDMESEAKRLTAELLTAHRADQAGWGPTTDCDRMDKAFETLNQQGIVARQDFSCCNNCGFTEIYDEVEAAEKDRPIFGYVFYHLQCTEWVIKTGQLLMAFGRIEEDSEALHRVGNAVVAELCRVGLNASWGGTDHHPIVVEGMVWRRRRE